MRSVAPAANTTAENDPVLAHNRTTPSSFPVRTCANCAPTRPGSKASRDVIHARFGARVNNRIDYRSQAATVGAVSFSPPERMPSDSTARALLGASDRPQPTSSTVDPQNTALLLSEWPSAGKRPESSRSANQTCRDINPVGCAPESQVGPRGTRPRLRARSCRVCLKPCLSCGPR